MDGISPVQEKELPEEDWSSSDDWEAWWEDELCEQGQACAPEEFGIEVQGGVVRKRRALS
jgi:hypothetical protein